MKYFIFSLLLFLPFVVFSQVDKMGYSKSEIMNSMQGQPCKQDSDNSIWYCDNNGNFQNYTFENDKVIRIFYMWEFYNKALAENNVTKEIEAAPLWNKIIHIKIVDIQMMDIIARGWRLFSIL